ncbi:MAG: hypothetical protein IJ054_06075 [Lachnospiraceae bacterium]|nr:hypothetical protein [Lachnospiraceae bacterium]
MSLVEADYKEIYMFNSKSKNARKEVEAIFNEIQINLENNYKDLAIGARKNAEKKLSELKEDGSLSDKDYAKLKSRLDDYTKRMEGYHH